MFFKKTKVYETEEIDEGELVLHVPRNSDLEKQIMMIGLTKRDLQLVRQMQPFIMKNIDGLVEQFYSSLYEEPSLIETINKHSSVEKLKGTLKNHIVEIFNGVIDQEYIEKRKRIAHIHVRIGLISKWYMCAFQSLFQSLSKIIQDSIENKDCCIQVIEAVSKVLNLEQQIVLEAYDQEVEAVKKSADIAKMKIRSNVTQATGNLASISEETHSNIQMLNNQSDEIVEHAEKGIELTLHMQEQADKGKEQIQRQDSDLYGIQSSIDFIYSDINELISIMKEMQMIVELVTGIANQTNLLSLNAAIEAARAGASGSGFSVVAQEVRRLSEDTKKSVSNVSELIMNSNDRVFKLTGNLKEICDRVREGNLNMEKTKENFEGILKGIVETKQQNDLIRSDIVTFTKVLEEITEAFQEVAVSAENLTTVAQEME